MASNSVGSRKSLAHCKIPNSELDLAAITSNAKPNAMTEQLAKIQAIIDNVKFPKL